MEKSIVELIKTYTKDFFVVKKEEGKSLLMLLFSYAPYERLNKKEYAQIDAYYFISNDSYHKAKELAKKLTERGIKAHYNFYLNYKQIISQHLFAGVGKNTLAYVEGFGSRFVMQAVELEGEHEYSTPIQKLQPNCTNCNLCKNACPTGAIKEEGFDYKKCLRYLQESKEFIEDEIARKMQNKLLGCDICQAVCPYNKDQKRTIVPSESKELFLLETLLNMAVEPSQLKKVFTSKIGKNYARESMILPNLMLIAGNSKNKALIQKLSVFKTHPNALIQKNVERSIKQLEYGKNS